MNLYKVRLKFETVVLANAPIDAEEHAHYVIQHEDESMPVEYNAEEIKSLADLPSEWDGNCIPYGPDKNNHMTSDQIIKEKAGLKS